MGMGYLEIVARSSWKEVFGASIPIAIPIPAAVQNAKPQVDNSALIHTRLFTLC